ncbi:unnamed protein product [Bursaphelenchus okinawaensis]|uniref:TPR_REGION domain-containing protein n=1 Tax=Bursaphelenchus okinawaensis TaxID=465554 RepID=A0A811L6H2_9BILA|nr:unnamed protein product [Bursaphelenchus okinawaensis]CAG9118546.1 unnamed protein product [Bursaphelenchus okinawaensis]
MVLSERGRENFELYVYQLKVTFWITCSVQCLLILILMGFLWKLYKRIGKLNKDVSGLLNREQYQFDVVVNKDKPQTPKPSKMPNGAVACRVNEIEHNWGHRVIRAASTTSSLVFHDATDELILVPHGDNPRPLPRKKSVIIAEVHETPIQRIDKMFENHENQKSYDELKVLLESKPDDVELLWRMARACHALGYKYGKNKELVQEGHAYATKAYTLSDKTDFEVIHWMAALSGSMTEFVGARERIKEGNNFKKYIEEALAIRPHDANVLYMRARLRFNIANLTWVERKAAAALSSDPPKATVEEAIEDFLAVDQYRPNWPENLFHLAEAYVSKGDKLAAKNVLLRMSEITPADEGDQRFLDEAKKLSKSV